MGGICIKADNHPLKINYPPKKTNTVKIIYQTLSITAQKNYTKQNMQSS